MTSIVLEFSEVLQEIRAIEDLAEPFIAADTRWVFERLATQLKAIQSSRAPGRWEIPEDQPLRTVECGGAYEAEGRSGSHKGVYGEITCLWEISPIVTTKKGPLTQFEISGIASTKLRLVDLYGDARRQLALWRLEIGDEHSPGVLFHTQIGEDNEDSEHHWPLPVPRIPVLPTTPLLAVEVLLAELFQSKWVERLAVRIETVNQWRNIQRPRHSRFLDWQREVIRNSAGAPWTAFKGAKPSYQLLVGE
jgi:hypothetical protein